MKILRALKGLGWVLAVLLVVLIVPSVIIHFASGHAALGPKRPYIAPDTLIAPEQLKEDLAFLFETLEAVHPDLYAALPRDTSIYQQALVAQHLREPLTPAAFYKRVAPLVAALEDGHTALNVPDRGFQWFREAGGVAFPFAVQYHEEAGLTIDVSYADAAPIASGDRLVRINGQDADSLFLAFQRYFSGKRVAFRNRSTVRNFRRMLWLHGLEAPYEVVYTPSDGTKEEVIRVEGVTRGAVIRQDSLRGTPVMQGRPYTYTTLSEGIGYLNFRSMRYPDRFASFLEETFTQIRDEQPAGLIIDLRQNGGGNSRLGNELLRYLTDQPYVMSGGKAWRMSALYKQNLRGWVPVWLRWVAEPPAIWTLRLFIDEARLMMVDDGEIVLLGGGSEQPEPTPLRYEGKVCFLIGSGTFSSAMMLANAVEDNALATLIGEESGGIPNHFGELYLFYLPNTGLVVRVSSAQFIRANGDAQNMQGVVPDIVVRPTPEEAAVGVDIVLERAKAWVLDGEA